MKKVVLENLVAMLNNEEMTMTRDDVLAAIQQELDNKAERSDALKDNKSKARAELIAKVKPIIETVLTDTDTTAVDLLKASSEWPEDFSANKLQYILTHELADMAVMTEHGRKARSYRRA